MLAALHYFGAFLLLAATALLIVTTITAPVVDDLALLAVRARDGDRALTLGTFGWCVLSNGGSNGNACSDVDVGYSPADLLERLGVTDIADFAENTARILTRVMILHPIAAGLCFIGSVLGFGSGIVGSFCASLMGLIAFLATLVALVCDFVLFTIVRNAINDNNNLGLRAAYAEGLWTLLAAAACAFLASIILFVTCCFGRSKRHRESKATMPMTTPHRPWYRRWG